MTIGSLTEGEFWEENKEEVLTKSGKDMLAQKVAELDKTFDSLETEALENLFANLDEIPPSALPRELRQSVYKLKFKAMQELAGEKRADQPISIDTSAPRVAIFELVDEMMARGVDKESILEQFEGELAKEVKERIEWDYEAGEYSLEGESSEEFFPFDAPDKAYQSELGGIDNAVFGDGDLDKAFAALLDGLDDKLSDPDFLQAYVYARVAADGEGHTLSDEVRRKEEAILEALGTGVRYDAIVEIRAKEMS